ncbi:MAG TPA: hypothetical protein VFQ25_01190 [Ktedonobacterales bacterium]|nr:hypothetical protein [Ktedonobacterales bacterium]
MTQATFRGAPLERDSGGTAPLITLFERDDAIAVPLLSQLRMSGYDVRAARTPVELFDILSKQLVSLVLVDLGAATAGRREFWVALDAQRRGRAIQVMTFRFISPHGDLDFDYEPSARAVADVEVHGAHEFQRIIDGVRQRVTLHGAVPPSGVSYNPNGGIQPLGAALGMAPTPFSAQNGHLFATPAATPASAPAGWGGIAPLGVSPLGVSPLEQAAPGGFSPLGALPAQGMPPGQAGVYGSYGPIGAMSPAPPQISAQMETTPFDPANPPGFTPFAPSGPSPFATPGASPFANPTPANPFGQGSSPFAQPQGSSPFAQPYDSNPFSSQPPISQPPFAMPATPPPVSSPASQSPAWNSGPSSFPPGFPPSFPPNAPSSFPPSFPPNAPSSYPGGFSPAPQGAPSSVPPWSSGGYVSLGAGARFGSDPAGFDSSPGFGAATPPPYSEPSAPAFQDAWSPPDGESDNPTGVVPEVEFQRQAAASSVHSDAWDTMRGPAAPQPQLDYIPPRSQLSPVANEAPESRAIILSTPTETALGSVLVDGALLTAGKLEALKGIQAMLAGVNIHRKLGDLALMFKFLSSDQLLAALLVSRGLVSPQQIASLGRVKQELSASGMDNDLETLLVSFRILPAEKLRQIRAELAS